MSTVASTARLAFVGLLFIAGCAAVSTAPYRYPMLAGELLSVAFVALWLVHVAQAARRALMDARTFSVQSGRAMVGGAAVRILAGPTPLAFVSGLFRPQIYLSPSLIDILDDQELRAVLLHERHHLSTRAPLRGLMLEAWNRTLGWLPPVRGALLARLATLEIEADAAAIAAGVPPSTLASALLKCDPHAPAAASAFSTAAAARIGELVAWGPNDRIDRRRSLPLEWAVPTTATFVLIACQLVGG